MKPREPCQNLCYETIPHTKCCRATSGHREGYVLTVNKAFFGALSAEHETYVCTRSLYFSLVTVRTVRDGARCEHEKQNKLDSLFPHQLLTLRQLLTMGYCQVLQTRYYMGVKCLCKHFGIDLLFFLFLLLNLQLDSLHLVDDSCGEKKQKYS